MDERAIVARNLGPDQKNKLRESCMKGRRRGADLEAALLDAAWEELTERGYARLTIESVAARADTSRPVFARRWEGKAELAIAAIRQQMAKSPLRVNECGDVRTELLEYLEHASIRARGIAAVFTLISSEYFDSTASTPRDLRAALAQGDAQVLAPILNRALARGEIDPNKLVPPINTLLTDLFRYYAIMNFEAPPPELRQFWIDKIFLPLVSPANKARSRRS
jgi:AcrR family transcriptional regulator